MGFGLDRWVEQGLLTLNWVPALEKELDELGEDLVEAIVKSGAKRVVVDGVDGFRHSASYKKRVNRFLIALVKRIKALGVTLVIVEEISLFRSHTQRQVAELSALNENVIYLRHVDTALRLKRMISIVKVRSAVFDSSSRELQIGKNGIVVR